MKRRRHPPEQIVRKLAIADKLLGEGKPIEDVCRELEVTESTFHRWQNQFDGIKANDAKRLEELEQENARLKKIVADQALDIGVSERRACAVVGQPDPSSCPSGRRISEAKPDEERLTDPMIVTISPTVTTGAKVTAPIAAPSAKGPPGGRFPRRSPPGR